MESLVAEAENPSPISGTVTADVTDLAAKLGLLAGPLRFGPALCRLSSSNALH